MLYFNRTLRRVYNTIFAQVCMYLSCTIEDELYATVREFDDNYFS